MAVVRDKLLPCRWAPRRVPSDRRSLLFLRFSSPAVVYPVCSLTRCAKYHRATMLSTAFLKNKRLLSPASRIARYAVLRTVTVTGPSHLSLAQFSSQRTLYNTHEAPAAHPVHPREPLNASDAYAPQEPVIVEPPRTARDHLPIHAPILYIGELPYEATEEAITDLLLSRRIQPELVQMTTHTSGQLKGFAHVTLKSVEDVGLALSWIRREPLTLNGRTLVVEPVQGKEVTPGSKEPSNYVFLSNMPWDSTEDDVHAIFASLHETIKPKSIRMTQSHNGQFNGAAVVLMNDVEEAKQIITLAQTQRINVLDRVINVDYRRPKIRDVLAEIEKGDHKPSHTLYVRNIPVHCTEEDLQKAFSQWSEEFADASIARDMWGTGLGFARVQFKDIQAAQEVFIASKTTPITLDGIALLIHFSHGEIPPEKTMAKKANPRPSFPTTKLHISNVEFDASEQDISAALERIGGVQLREVYLGRDETGRSSGWAFVHFHNVEDAERVITAAEKEFLLIKDRPVIVTRAIAPAIAPAEGTRVIFIGLLEPSVDARKIHIALSPYARPVSVRVQRSNKQGDYRGFAFATFRTPAEVQRVLGEHHVNPICINSTELKLEPSDGEAAERPQKVIKKRRSFDPTNRIYVASVSFDAKTDDLRAVLGKASPVPFTEMRMSRDPSGKSMGWAILTFSDVEAAKTALAAFQSADPPLSILGRQMFFEYAKAYANPSRAEEAPESDILFLGGLPLEATPKDVRTMLAERGFVPRDVRFSYDAEGYARGFAHVQLKSIEVARAVLEANDETAFVVLGERVRLGFAPQRRQNNELVRSNRPSPQIFIGGVPPEAKVEDVRKACAYFSTLKAKIGFPRDPDGAPRGFALVSFATVKDAEKAMAWLHENNPKVLGQTIALDYGRPRA